MTMTAEELANLQVELDEINAQLSEMVGSPNFSVGGFTVDENGLMKGLQERKASLEWRISNAGSATDTAGTIVSGNGY